MYIKKDFLKLKLDELADYTAQGFALCYVEECDQLDIRDKDDERTHKGYRLFFTNADMKDQWGDDWNDAPYDCNAGWPYDTTYYEDENGKWQRTEHTILVLNVTYDIEHTPYLPCDYYYNASFTAENINLGAIAWMFFDRQCKPIYAGDGPLTVWERTAKWMGECPEINYENDEG